mmetsp:Transcript_14351/g.25810  ORF Transcript_14351/g.25810 Transcript_14351/m.25810 type:complete len:233 (-) Transcript_14351:248-946(-)
MNALETNSNELVFLQLLNKLLHTPDHYASFSLRWILDVKHRQPRRDVNIEVLNLDRIHRLLLGLHNVGQRGISWLVQTQVAGHHRRQSDFNRGETPVNLTRDRQLSIVRLHFRCKGRLRPPQQPREHLARLPCVRVNRLLAHDNHVRLDVFDDFGEDFGRCEGLEFLVRAQVCGHVNGLVGAHGKSSAERLLSLFRTDGDDDHFLGDLPLLHLNCLLDCDLTEGVHGHFGVF